MSDATSEQTTPAAADPASEIQEPPTSFGGIVRQLGPGLIIAASIVGSGELIATTKTGAQAGIALFWLIIVGCVIKVFVQIELGRLAIGQGETTLTSLNKVPGPRLVVNWIVWYWLIMMIVGFGQLGGIIGGVGQSLALGRPLKGDYVAAVRLPSETELKRFIAWRDDLQNNDGATLRELAPQQQERIKRGMSVIEDRLAELDKVEQGKSSEVISLVGDLIAREHEALAAEDKVKTDGGEFDKGAFVRKEQAAVDDVLKPWTWDDKYWSIAVAILTICLLVRGKYGLIQNLSTVLVVAFTFVTLGNVIALQFEPAYSLSMAEVLAGLIPSLPAEGIAPPGLAYWTVSRPLATALATFGIIGVGATELV
ncbi:MAG: hypothetical protein VB858_06995, partial [Planctomycetaceae bacterium]